MASYIVPVQRVTYESIDVVVKADNVQDAIHTAKNIASNHPSHSGWEMGNCSYITDYDTCHKTSKNQKEGFLKTDYVQEVYDFFYNSPEVKNFIECHCSGQSPWIIKLTHSGHILIANHGRDMFGLIEPKSGFPCHLYTDPLYALVNPGEEGALQSENSNSSLEESFQHLGIMCDLSAENLPSPQ